MDNKTAKVVAGKLERRSYDERITALSTSIEVNTKGLHQRMDTQENTMSNVMAEVSGLRDDLRKHMEDEETTLATVQENLHQEYKRTVQEPLEPVIQLVKDAEGFANTVKRLGRIVVFITKFIVAPVLVVAGYLVSQGWF